VTSRLGTGIWRTHFLQCNTSESYTLLVLSEYVFPTSKDPSLHSLEHFIRITVRTFPYFVISKHMLLSAGISLKYTPVTRQWFTRVLIWLDSHDLGNEVWLIANTIHIPEIMELTVDRS
jgi:hypothetical protein